MSIRKKRSFNLQNSQQHQMLGTGYSWLVVLDYVRSYAKNQMIMIKNSIFASSLLCVSSLSFFKNIILVFIQAVPVIAQLVIQSSLAFRCTGAQVSKRPEWVTTLFSVWVYTEETAQTSRWADVSEGLIFFFLLVCYFVAHSQYKDFHNKSPRPSARILNQFFSVR